MAQIFQVNRKTSTNNQSGKEIVWYEVAYVTDSGAIKTQSFQQDPKNRNRVLGEDESKSVAEEWAKANAPDVEGFKVTSVFNPKTSLKDLWGVQAPNLTTGKWETLKGDDGKDAVYKTTIEARTTGLRLVADPTSTASGANAAESRIPGATTFTAPPPATGEAAQPGGLPSVDFLAHALLDGSGPADFAATNAAAAKAGDATAIAVQNRALEVATERGFFGGTKKPTPSTPSTPGAPATAPPSTGGTPPAPELPITIDSTKLDSDEMYNLVKAGYGWAAMYLKDRELGPLIRKAAVERWGPDEILGALQNTQWWQRTDVTARNFDIERARDPATQDTVIAKRLTEINRGAASAGLQIAGVVDLGEFGRYNRAYYMAVQSIREGWTKEEMSAAILQEGGFDPTKAQRAGSIKAQAYNIKEMAAEFLLPMDDTTANKYSVAMLTGGMNKDVFVAMLKDQAKMRFPSMAGMIDRGTTPNQFFDSYRSHIANILEMDINQIDFMDPRWSEVLDYADPNTGQSRFMTLTEAGNWAKQRQGWDSTQQAADATARASKGLYWSFDNPAGSSNSSGLSTAYSKPFAN